MSIDKTLDVNLDTVIKPVDSCPSLKIMELALNAYRNLDPSNFIVPAEEAFREDCVRTISGRFVNVFNPDPSTIIIEDIAHSLWNQSRFGGHLASRYCVLQHLLYGMAITPRELRYEWGNHENGEGYMLDLPGPIKLKLPDYKATETNLLGVTSKLFGFEFPFPPIIKEIDNTLLLLEYVNVHIKGHKSPFIEDIFPYDTCKEVFLEIFYALAEERKIKIIPNTINLLSA